MVLSMVLSMVQHTYSPAYIGPKKWNALPEEYHNIVSKNIFKARVTDKKKGKWGDLVRIVTRVGPTKFSS